MQEDVPLLLPLSFQSKLNTGISVERIKQFMQIPQEPPKISEDKRPPSSWPSSGRMEFQALKQVGSVLYVSFGSGGTLSQEQMIELAYGLELSNLKFLWVVRAPNNTANAAYLGAQKHVDPFQFLPCGFLERTKEQGMVVPSWAPQIQILSHSSVGGFLTHCGWNSTLESVLHGVPLITWPLYAEQRMNAVVLSEGLKVGVRPRVNENGFVERVDIVEVIKCLMEGKEGGEMRKRMKELKKAAANALKEDGSSTKTLSQLALKWKNLAWENKF
ncbi:Hydroquinone glucosyltransferase [Spatholobus suberectus]|nr:Hydroquinone glucosyltransferase [Spatholobus suberectus]